MPGGALDQPVDRGGDGLLFWAHPMRSYLQRVSMPLLAALLVATLCGCGGSAFKKDTTRLKKRCDIVRGDPVSEENARCIARLYGVRNTKSCPMKVDRPDSFPRPVYRIRESCTGLGVVLAESSGRVLALVADDEILH